MLVLNMHCLVTALAKGIMKASEGNVRDHPLSKVKVDVVTLTLAEACPRSSPRARAQVSTKPDLLDEHPLYLLECRLRSIYAYL